MRAHHRWSHPSTARVLGVSLVEALVAMAVMAFGMLAVVGVQSTLRFNADVARQRSEATRLAQAEIERLRSFIGIEAQANGLLDWDEVATQLGTDVTPAAAFVNTTFTMNRRVFTPAGSAQKQVAVQVNWVDRLGTAQSVVLSDTIAGAAPVLSGLVTAAAAVRTASSQTRNRHPTIPVRAHDMGNGESVFKPNESGAVAWTFNNVTGVITKVCAVALVKTSDTLVASDVVVGTNCVATVAQLLSGYVRFNLRGASTDLSNGTSSFLPIPGSGLAPWIINHATPFESPFDPVNDPTYVLLAVDSEKAAWTALPLSIDPGITSPNRPTTGVLDECFSDAPAASGVAINQKVVEYFCIIPQDTTLVSTWTGKPVIAPGSFADDPTPLNWAIGTAAGQYQVCRYRKATTDLPAGSPIARDNTDHPFQYLGVKGNLINQNFLVIYGTKTCPTDVAADPGAGDFVNSNTRPHQP